MIAFLPLIIFFTAGIILRLMTWMKPGVQNWVLAFVSSLAVYLLILIMPIRFTDGIQFTNWTPFTSQSFVFGVIFDRTSWLLLYSLAALLFGVLWVSFAYSPYLLKREYWSVALFTGGLAAFAFSANNILTFILVWILFDLLGYFILKRRNDVVDEQIIQTSFMPVGVSLAGTMLLIVALIFDPGASSAFGSSQLSNVSVILLLTAVVVKSLSIIGQEVPVRESIDQYFSEGLYRIALVISSLVILLRVDFSGLDPAIVTGVSVLISIMMLYNSARWFFTDDLKRNNKYVIRFFLLTALLLIVRSDRLAAIHWMAIFLINYGMIFLGQCTFRRKIWLLVLCLLAASALPFTPFAPAWHFLAASTPFGIVVVLSFAMVVGGIIRIAKEREEISDEPNRWLNFFGVIGIFILFATQWLYSLKVPADSIDWSTWWAPAFALGLGTIGFLVFSIAGKRIALQGQKQGSKAHVITHKSLRFLELGWMIKIGRFLENVLNAIVRFITSLLEGEAGLLWSLLALTLLITIIQAGKR